VSECHKQQESGLSIAEGGGCRDSYEPPMVIFEFAVGAILARSNTNRIEH
jgi:hypothetical protein